MSAAVGDLHLQNNSPGIDAGTNSAPNLPQTDFGGNPRILDGNNDCLSTVDLGAYEVARTANVSFSTSALNFPSQVPGTSSAPQSVALSNTGGTCFQFSSVGIAGDFSQSNTCSALGLRAGNSCVFSIKFNPVALGTRLGALTASGSDGITFADATVSLSGIGADFSISATPSSATVKHGQSGNFTVALSPIGGSFTSTIALSCSGLPSGVACSFSPASVTLGNQARTSTLLVSTNGKTSRGKFNLIITGDAGGVAHSTAVLLTVN